MRTGISYLLATAFLIAIPAMANAEIKRWDPPEGMAWDTPSKKCNPTRMAGPVIEGCYYGKAEDPTDHKGLAFFRKCVGFRQSQPFLVVDFDKNEFHFNTNPSKEGARIHTYDLKDGQINPEDFYAQLPPIIGSPCYPQGGDPA